MLPDLRPTHWYMNEKMGWYEYVFPFKEYSIGYSDRYNDIVDWILEHLDKPYHHVRWHVNNMHIRVKFRYERDYLRFVLTWS